MDEHVQIFWEIEHVYTCKLIKNESEKQPKTVRHTVLILWGTIRRIRRLSVRIPPWTKLSGVSDNNYNRNRYTCN